ncbi:host attachment protein [Caulobacter segnis]
MTHPGDPRDRAEKAFLRDLASRLDDLNARHGFDQVILVAPPRAPGPSAPGPVDSGGAQGHRLGRPRARRRHHHHPAERGPGRALRQRRLTVWGRGGARLFPDSSSRAPDRGSDLAPGANRAFTALKQTFGRV